MVFVEVRLQQRSSSFILHPSAFILALSRRLASVRFGATREVGIELNQPPADNRRYCRASRFPAIKRCVAAFRLRRSCVKRPLVIRIENSDVRMRVFPQGATVFQIKDASW